MRPPTPSQTVGPFFGFALPLVDSTGDGRIEGQVLDGAGEPVTDALLEIWQGEHFSRCRTDDEGAFHFAMPEAADFVNVTVFARGLLRHLNTRMYMPDAHSEIPAQIDPDRRSTLVARREGGVLRWDIRLQGPQETVFFL
jgi:protocatechuate 3,4-dioxygenase, alpha subunit